MGVAYYLFRVKRPVKKKGESLDEIEALCKEPPLGSMSELLERFEGSGLRETVPDAFAAAIADLGPFGVFCDAESKFFDVEHYDRLRFGIPTRGLRRIPSPG